MKTHCGGKLSTGAALMSCTVLTGACGTVDSTATRCVEVEQLRDVSINIRFVNGCPQDVDKGGNDNPFDVDRRSRVIWQAVDSDGSTPEYAIYFDPFKGGPLESRQGVIRSRPFDSCSPAAEYKYTIVGARCKDKPLDPRFRLR